MRISSILFLYRFVFFHFVFVYMVLVVGDFRPPNIYTNNFAWFSWFRGFHNSQITVTTISYNKKNMCWETFTNCSFYRGTVYPVLYLSPSFQELCSTVPAVHVFWLQSSCVSATPDATTTHFCTQIQHCEILSFLRVLSRVSHPLLVAELSSLQPASAANLCFS